MCGIIASEKPLTMKQLFAIYDKEIEGFLQRGDDSLGVLCISRKNNDYSYVKMASVKTEENLMKFLEESEDGFIEWEKKYDLFIYHNRWASVGAKTVELAHPIVEKDWIVVHNGTRHGADILSAKSDTQGFARYLLDGGKLRDIFLKGCGVLFALNIETGDIFFHKDDTRSLFYSESEKIYSSEPLNLIKDWTPVKDVMYTNFEDVEFGHVNDSEKFLKMEKVKPTYSCDCCHKRSSNAVQIGTDRVCYNCLSELEFKESDIIKSTKTVYGGSDYGRGMGV